MKKAFQVVLQRRSVMRLLFLPIILIAHFELAGQVQLAGAMINACGAEGNQEFVTLTTSGSINPNLINITYGNDGANCANNTVIVYNTNLPEPPGFTAILNGLAGCTAFVAGSNPIPAGSNIIIFDIDLDPNQYTGWSAFCGNTTYVLFTNLPNSGGNFSNADGATRYFCLSYNGGPSSIYGYINPSNPGPGVPPNLSTYDGTTVSWSGPGTVNANEPTSNNCSFGTAVPCNITAIVVTPTGSCNDNGTPGDPSDDFIPSNITITFVGQPATGLLQLLLNANPTPIASVSVGAIAPPTHTFNNINLPSNGAAYTLTAEFSDETTCTFTENLTAPPSCSACGLAVSGTPTAPSCQGANDGSITLSPTNGSPAY
ncbi:MAG TPA: hypothetical protein PLL53_19775, partial [Saprospiraceae bacterium]|nr:hypothetical protein [Saprospiraceae bacterium]